ncbi:hypothetical protein GIB67_028466 [Kingdonia uniflora]|uniref:Uncharacterized protein n=1 Tax=Kingdonia uniflora TaxID=39325 RepID=A0A7J7P1W2_9MAGN|nr:hypothetical protein GIB67_028466 [Kingdonia uniflora]
MTTTEEEQNHGLTLLLLQISEPSNGFSGDLCDVQKGISSSSGGLNVSVGRVQVIEEVKKQLWLAGPLISVNLLQYCLQVISVMFVGHLGELCLSGASMATSFCYCHWF